jgi:hypothetical protein
MAFFVCPQVKFEKKLEEVVQRRGELEALAAQEGEGAEVKDTQGQGQSKVGRSLEDQFSQFKKRNGTLNTRQVFDMLKQEEKKTTKVHSVIGYTLRSSFFISFIRLFFLSFFRSFVGSFFLSFFLSSLSFFFSFFLSFCLSVRLSKRPSICPSVRPSVHPSFLPSFLLD